jgi:hypothetical protein
MDHRPSFSSLPARYDAFLFAQVCDEANGAHLSVISALARMNVDPWDEATRLAAMPKAIAEKTLLSILELVSENSWKSTEAKAIVARLVHLLPQAAQGATTAAAKAATSTMQHANYWWVWVCFAVAMSLLTPHHAATTAHSGIAMSDSDATEPVKSDATVLSKSNIPVPEAVGLSH